MSKLASTMSNSEVMISLTLDFSTWRLFAVRWTIDFACIAVTLASLLSNGFSGQRDMSRSPPMITCTFIHALRLVVISLYVTFKSLHSLHRGRCITSASGIRASRVSLSNVFNTYDALKKLDKLTPSARNLFLPTDFFLQKILGPWYSKDRYMSKGVFE